MKIVTQKEFLDWAFNKPDDDYFDYGGCCSYQTIFCCPMVQYGREVLKIEEHFTCSSNEWRIFNTSNHKLKEIVAKFESNFGMWCFPRVRDGAGFFEDFKNGFATQGIIDRYIMMRNYEKDLT